MCNMCNGVRCKYNKKKTAPILLSKRFQSQWLGNSIYFFAPSCVYCFESVFFLGKSLCINNNKNSIVNFDRRISNELRTFFFKQTSHSPCFFGSSKAAASKVPAIVINYFKMADDKCRQRAFMRWRNGRKTMFSTKHLETASIDGVMMSWRWLCAKKFIEFNPNFIVVEKWQCCGYWYFLSLSLTPCFLPKWRQNNLQNGWIKWLK